MIRLIDHLAGNDRLRDKSCFALPFLGDKYTSQFSRVVIKTWIKGAACTIVHDGIFLFAGSCIRRIRDVGQRDRERFRGLVRFRKAGSSID